ncbi:MAG: arsenite methyltransferase [Deltaproteobacteria bacterium]|nr:arsenite methyltransferase [Deltaproteobacteria bacterium]
MAQTKTKAQPKLKVDRIRKGVSASYAKAVKRPSGSGCCGGAPAQKGVTAKLGGYSSKELASLPSDAVVNSFGCGNPVAMSGLKAGQTVLDLGSGAGIDVLLAAKKVGPRGRVIGVDMTREMVRKARANAKAAGLTNVEVRQGIIEKLPVESGTVDWVLSNCVINLSPEKERVFREIARVLKPGGQMLVSDVVAQRLPDVVRKDERLYASCISGAISEANYLAGLRAAGLEGAKVLERLVYDAEQLEALFFSEMPEEGGQGCCGGGGCGCGTASPQLLPVVRRLVGRVWSARISARKPETEARARRGQRRSA